MPFGVIFLYIRMGEGGEEKREGAPELGFGFPQKLIRTSESPFRMAAAAVSPGAPLFTPNGTAGPFLLYSDGAAVYDAREPEPLAASAVARAFHPSPLAVGAFRSAAAVLRYPQFTPAQWQELQRQALIYKYLASSVPVPADLLFESGALALPALPLFSAAGGGGAGGYYGVRFPGADSADPEPGRCRRTDGKKWRCARDAAPEQKYCERHMHRGRPRSRKPVEPASKTAGSASTGVSPAGNGAPLPRPGVKLPFLSMAPEKDTRYMDWVDGRIEAMQPNSSGGDGFPCSYQGGRHNHAGSSCSDPNDPISYSFLVPELDNTRRFIDAWSTESLSVPPADPEPALREKTCSTNLLPGSALTLSMSGSGEDHEGAGGVQMGVSAPGGPLGEVLRPSNVVSPSGGSGGACSCGGGSLASLVGKGGSGSGSPRESPPRMLLSSPTGVLQRSLVSLSDSSCNSSPSFAAVAAAGSGDGRPEATGLPWTSANAKKW